MDLASATDVTEDITASLVREYLSRKGLQSTLTALDQELPRTEASISNRVQLAKSIGVEKLMRKNKESERPYRTILEVISANYLEKIDRKKPVSDSFEDVLETKEDMYRQMKNRVEQKNSEQLILEDAEDGETLVGDGSVASQRPDSGPLAGQQRTYQKHRHSHGRVTSNLNDREQEKLKRALKQPKYFIDDDTDRNSGANVRDRSFSVPSSLNESPVKRAPAKPEPVKAEPVKEPTRKTSLESNITKDRPPSGSQRKVDVRKVFQESEPEVRVARVTSTTSNSSVTKSNGVAEKKPKSRAELLAMLDMEDPNKIGPNALKDIEEPRLVEKDAGSKLGDLELNDLDEADLAEAELIQPVQPKVAATTKRQSRPIDFNTAVELKRVIFGTSLQQFYDEWKLQSFAFTNVADVRYGIVQKKGGPCGVLAAVQACCLQDLLFGTAAAPEMKKLRPMRSERTESLVIGLSTILWRCSDAQSAVVALPSGRSYFSGSDKFKADGLTETLLLTEFDDWKELTDFIRSNITQFEAENAPGVVLLLYSAILSRGTENVRADMDDPDGKLMGQHFYCTQDMVNLLLTGRAASNVFNDVIELGGSDDVTVLKGLTKRSDIGFLSLFEHFKSCQVGTYYKTPKYPIWVVCCESHFSVLFSTKKDLVSDWKAERRFDLFFYDGLANQREEIRLTIDTTSRFYTPPVDEDMVPPLENCIRTKWPDADIDWNGTEPLL